MCACERARVCAYVCVCACEEGEEEHVVSIDEDRHQCPSLSLVLLMRLVLSSLQKGMVFISLRLLWNTKESFICSITAPVVDGIVITGHVGEVKRYYTWSRPPKS